MKHFISRRDFLKIAGAAGVAGALTACGGSTASSGAASTASGAKAEYTLKVSHTQNADTPVVQGMYEFQRIVEEKSGGRMKIEVYPSGSLGDTAELVTQCLSGSNIGFMTDAGRFTDFVPEMGILNAPYVINSYEEGLKAVESDYFNALLAQMESEG